MSPTPVSLIVGIRFLLDHEGIVSLDVVLIKVSCIWARNFSSEMVKAHEAQIVRLRLHEDFLESKQAADEYLDRHRAKKNSDSYYWVLQ
jgi:hypothetical protein